MSNIAEVIGWKFDQQPGMKCKAINGVLTIVEFPGGVPSQSDQDAWVAEYEAYIAAKPLDAASYTLTRAQLRNMFVEDGKTANFIKTLVIAMPTGKARERAIIMLEDTDTFTRDHILLTKIVAAGLYTDAQLDAMWIAQGSGD